jgi:chromosome segregation ATPase
MAVTHDPLERRLRLGEQLSCRELFAELEQLDEQIVALTARVAELDRVLSYRQGELSDLETLAALGVEGKNEAERKARRIEALRNDATYQAALDLLRSTQAERDRVEAELDAAKRKARRIERRIEYQVAVLRFLGGSG